MTAVTYQEIGPHGNNRCILRRIICDGIYTVFSQGRRKISVSRRMDSSHWTGESQLPLPTAV